MGPCVVEVKYLCSSVAVSPAPSHHLGLAQGGAIVPHLVLPHRKWSEPSSGADSPVPSHHLGLAQGGAIPSLCAPPCRKWTESFSGVGVGAKLVVSPKWAQHILKSGPVLLQS